MGASRFILLMFLSFPLKSQGSLLYYLPGYDIAPAMLLPPAVQATSGCICKQECMARADCTAVSVTSQQLGDVSCSFTATRLEEPGVLAKGRTFLEQLMNSMMFSNDTAANTATYIKTLPCVSPFETVEGVGCISRIHKYKNFVDASIDCPVASELVVLASDNTFRSLNKYLLDTDGSNANYWLGITKSDDGIWKWDDGRAIIDTVGVYPWKESEPNGGTIENCASLQMKGTNEYMLVDRFCRNTIGYICQLK